MELLLGFLASLIAGLSTGIGAIPILLMENIRQDILDVSMGFSAGIMLSASFFSLLMPAIEMGGITSVIVGFTLGGVIFDVADRSIPHFHRFIGYEGPGSKIRKVWLMIIAITIHNFPEGISVGVGFGLGDVKAALALAIGIGLQNIPEGSAVAFPLFKEGYGKWRAFAYSTLSGLVEPVGGLLGLLLVSLSSSVLPYALSFAAGAMVYVVSDEMIPETHRCGVESKATFGLMAGFVLMMVLDVILS